MNRLVMITTDPLVMGMAFAAAAEHSAGAVDLFIGTTRAQTDGRIVRILEYEAYEPMAKAVMERLIDAAAAQWPLRGVAILHRIGVVPVGEASVIIAVSGVHRAEAFEACRFLIDRVKADAPIWKRERFDDGSAHWVGDPSGHGAAPAR